MLLPEKTAFIFPGQGSQFVGMGVDLAKKYPQAGEVYSLADSILRLPLSSISWNGSEEQLNDTINTQPALLIHSVAALRTFEAIFPDFKPAFTAGHSMGELSALVAAGSLTFDSALPLVRARGEVMKNAGLISPGGMAAILGLDIPVLEHICSEASNLTDSVQVANDNCPGQVVISGSTSALNRALKLATEAGAKRAIPLAVSIAAHSTLMQPAQEEFNHAVKNTPIKAPIIPIIGNVAGVPLNDPDAIRADLEAQLTSRVRWTESIQWMIAQGITSFIEVGSGNVLTGLLHRIDRSVSGYTLGTPQDFEKISDLMI